MTGIKDLQDYVFQLKLIDKREKLKITKQLEAKIKPAPADTPAFIGDMWKTLVAAEKKFVLHDEPIPRLKQEAADLFSEHGIVWSHVGHGVTSKVVNGTVVRTFIPPVL